jgi:hypothetical protein
MVTRVILTTAGEYGRALAPHVRHDGYRCDDPRERLMGRGCRTCGVEAVITIADFRASGDLAAFERELKAGSSGKDAP